MGEDLLETLAAERAIRRLIARYGELVAHADAEAAREIFAADAWVQIADFPPRDGLESIVRGLSKTLSAFRWLDQKTDSGLIEVTGETAQARFQVIEFNERLDNGDVAMILGAYDDDYVRREGKWLFHRRKFTLRTHLVIANTRQKH